MLFLVLLWWFVQGTVWYKEMVLVTCSWVKSMYSLSAYLFFALINTFSGIVMLTSWYSLPSLALPSYESLSHMMLYVSGQKTFENAWANSPNICKSWTWLVLTWQFQDGISMAIVQSVKITSIWPTWRVLGGHLVKILKQHGLVQIH